MQGRLRCVNHNYALTYTCFGTLNGNHSVARSLKVIKQNQASSGIRKSSGILIVGYVFFPPHAIQIENAFILISLLYLYYTYTMYHFVSILDIETSFFPWLMDEVSHNLEKSYVARDLLDSKKLHA